MLSSSSDSEVNSVTSYMTMQGNSAKANSAVVSSATEWYDDGLNDKVNGASVSVILNVNALIDNTKSFVVLGDGANGANGADGQINLGGNRVNGDNGGNGGKAGYIATYDIEDDGLLPTIYKGADGVGGNGGNGADGTNAKGLNNLSTGGGGGGAYGLDAYLYSRNDSYNLAYTDTPISTTAEILSNRRETRDGTNLDTTKLSALAGSGGTGGLGLIYYNESRSDIENAFNRTGWMAGRNGPTYYYGNGENVVTYYITSAGGGSAGLRYLNGTTNTAIKGSYGDDGKYFSPTSSLRANGINRGKYKPWLLSDDNIEKGQDENTRAYYGYYWSDHHGAYANEFFFGNLQYIPAFAHWWIKNIDDFEGADIISPSEDYEAEWDYEGTASTWGGELWHNTTYEGDRYPLLYYINNSHNLSDGNNWKEIFYGGKGGTYVSQYISILSDDDFANLHLAGGTPYTSEIYGYENKVGLFLSNPSYDKYFFSRNDMVTSAGHYGTAQGLTAQGAPDLTK